MKKLLLPVLLSALSFNAMAQAPEADDPSSQQGPPRWGLGFGAMVADSPYVGEGTRVVPIPLVSFHGEKFSMQGLTAGWKLFGNDSFELSAIAKLRLDAFKVSDLGRAELAANGVDYRLLEDRDNGIDLGLGAKWSGAAGEIEAEILADVVDASGGQEISVKYGYPFEVGKGRLTPGVGVTWLSKDMANYYFGTLDKEIARGVVDYKPGSVTIPQIGVSYFRPVGEKWSVVGFLEYRFLPSGITDSPLLDPAADGMASMFIGLSRGF